MNEQPRAEQPLRETQSEFEQRSKDPISGLSLTDSQLTQKIVECNLLEEKVTESKAAAHEGERLYRSIFAAMAEGVVLQMADGTIAACNASAEHILGLSADQMMGRTSLDPRWRAVHEDGSPFSGETHPSMVTLRTGQPCKDVVMGVHKPDGTLTWISINSQPVLHPGVSLPTAVVTTFVDISERRRLQDRLRKAAEEWQTTFDSIKDLVMLLDQEYRVLRVNTATLSFLHLPMEEVIGKHCYELMHDTHSPVEECPFKQAVCSNQHEEAEIYHTEKDLWLLVSVDPIAEERSKIIGFTHSVKDITERKQAESALQEALNEVKRLQDKLQQENVYLRQEVKLLHGHHRIVGQSLTIRKVLARIEQVASTASTVLLLGETGTGKELLASTIHDLSPRRTRAMVRVNCAAIPVTLIESELFGREKGAYTGALSKQIGRFEMADESTIFLDEISELPPEVQAKLLRVLQEKEFERLGSPKPVQVDVRIIAATNQDIEAAIKTGRFRQDLFYRLNVFPIVVPPLRERREDIPLLVWAFVDEFSKTMGKNIESIAQESMDALTRYPWPGNIRELRNVIERAMIITSGSKMRIELPGAIATMQVPGLAMDEVERSHILRVLEMTSWRIRGKNGAAEVLGLKPTTLESRMAKLGLSRPPK